MDLRKTAGTTEQQRGIEG